MSKYSNLPVVNPLKGIPLMVDHDPPRFDHGTSTLIPVANLGGDMLL